LVVLIILLLKLKLLIFQDNNKLFVFHNFESLKDNLITFDNQAIQGKRMGIFV